MDSCMFLSYHGVFILRRFFLSLYFCSARFHDDILVLTQKQEKLRTFNETFMVMAHFYNTHYDRVSRMDRASEKKRIMTFEWRVRAVIFCLVFELEFIKR